MTARQWTALLAVVLAAGLPTGAIWSIVSYDWRPVGVGLVLFGTAKFLAAVARDIKS